MKAKHYPEKRKCSNPKCGGVYYVDANQVVVKMCRCLAKFNQTLTKDLAKIGKVPFK